MVIDPALPLGLVGPTLGGLPYAVVLHGAEVTVPGRLPGLAPGAGGGAAPGPVLAVCAGGYPAAEARRVAGARMPPVVDVPPGVDIERLRPLTRRRAPAQGPGRAGPPGRRARWW